jgi:ubiquitin C-terminal hydrolase
MEKVHGGDVKIDFDELMKNDEEYKNKVQKYLNYNLKGIVIHSGTAQGGHYYSYIKVKNGITKAKDTWLEFNDTNVSEFNHANLEAKCFGGKSNTS